MDIIVFIILATISYFIVIFIHETGHTVVGLLSGFKFHLLVLGPFGWKRREDGKIVFYIEKNPALWGGCQATLPAEDKKDNFDVFARILIWGPLTSLIFGVILLLIFSYIKTLFILLLGMMSVGISLATLIPMRAGSFYSDGGRWLRIKRKGHDAEVEVAIFNLIQSTSVHQNYAKINLKDTETLMNDSDNRNQYLGHFIAYKHYLEKDEKESVEKELQIMSELEQKIPKNYVKLLKRE